MRESGREVGEKTGEKVGESLGEIDKLKLCRGGNSLKKNTPEYIFCLLTFSDNFSFI